MRRNKDRGGFHPLASLKHPALNRVKHRQILIIMGYGITSELQYFLRNTWTKLPIFFTTDIISYVETESGLIFSVF